MTRSEQRRSKKFESARANSPKNPSYRSKQRRRKIPKEKPKGEASERIPTSILFLYYNLSGGKSKVHHMNDLLSTTSSDVIAFCETWWNTSTNTDMIVAGTEFECFYRNRVRDPHGGVAIFIKKILNAKLLMTWPSLEKIEAISLEFESGSKEKTLITLLYWPPGAMNQYIADMQLILQWTAQQPYESKLLLGDFNLANVGWEESEHELGTMLPNIVQARPYERDTISLFDDGGFAQLNANCNANGHFLDLVLYTLPEKFTLLSEIDEHPIYFPITDDHQPVGFELQIGLPIIEEENYIEKRYIDHRMLEQKLAALPINSCVSQHQTQEYICHLMSIFQEVTRTKRLKVPKWAVRHPWLIESRKYKSLRIELQKAKRIPSNAAEIRRIHINMRIEYEHRKEIYFRKIILSLSGEKRELFDVLRYKKARANSLPDIMTHEGNELKGNERYEAIAAHLSNAFAGADQEIYNKNSIEHNIENLWKENFQSGQDWCDFANITREEILNKIANLDVKKDPGPQKIAAHTVKMHGDRLSEILLPIFIYCARHAWIPEDWKAAYITPIPKKGDKKCVKNYRGICMSSVIPKLFDAVITDKVNESVDEKLSHTQHGFRKKRGTHTCLLEAAQFIESNMSGKSRVDCIFIDFEKAFDKISHATIVKKLARLGAPLKTVLTIMELVVGRNYTMKIGAMETETILRPMSSVPQGSHIGPVLFVIVANDLSQNIAPQTKLIQYADDVLLLQVISEGNDENYMQASLNRANGWATRNKLKINAEKTKAMNFTRGALDRVVVYTLAGENIETVEEIDYLGVKMDKKHNYNRHLRELGEKSMRMANVASRLAKYIGDRRLNLVFFNIYNDPTITYAAHIWDRNRGSMDKIIDAGHHRATRNTLATPFRPHLPGYRTYEERCAILNQPTAKQRRQQQSAFLCLKILRAETRTQITQELRQSLFIPRENDRGIPTLFNPRSPPLAMTLPLGRMASNLERLKSGIDIYNDSLQLVKRKLKMNVLNQN